MVFGIDFKNKYGQEHKPFFKRVLLKQTTSMMQSPAAEMEKA